MKSKLPISVSAIEPHFHGAGCTYFRTSDVIPFVEDGILKVYKGDGIRRSWGRATVDSDVTKITDDVVEVKVVGWHKHTVSPVGGSYYFVNEKGGWKRRRANAKAVKFALITRQ